LVLVTIDIKSFMQIIYKDTYHLGFIITISVVSHDMIKVSISDRSFLSFKS